MIPSRDLCSHGNPFYECQICMVEMKMKSPVNLVDNPFDWEFEVPHAPLSHSMNDTLSKHLIEPIHPLENQIKGPTRLSTVSSGIHSGEKTLFDQRNDLLSKKLPGQQELEDATNLEDINKKFMKKKEF